VVGAALRGGAVAVAVGVAVGVGVGVSVAAGDAVAVAVGDGVAVAVGVAVLPPKNVVRPLSPVAGPPNRSSEPVRRTTAIANAAAPVASASFQ
jgi:hypothetical protein